VTVSARIVDHGKEKKIIVFKKKRRKNYSRKQGHRQHFTAVQIKTIEMGG
jgi:large subunit ribosomal protein L21